MPTIPPTGENVLLYESELILQLLFMLRSVTNLSAFVFLTKFLKGRNRNPLSTLRTLSLETDLHRVIILLCIKMDFSFNNECCQIVCCEIDYYKFDGFYRNGFSTILMKHW